jgi:arsenate reductase (thioredoxin)
MSLRSTVQAQIPMLAKGILFLSAANSVQSQMAEGLARRVFGREVPVMSAGAAPAAMSQYAIQVMDELGIDIATQRPKSVSEIDPRDVGLVVTLSAQDTCPKFPGPVSQLHWPLPDLSTQSGETGEEMLSRFRAARDRILGMIELFASDELGQADTRRAD